MQEIRYQLYHMRLCAGSFNCSSKQRVKNTVIVETKAPSKEADCDLPITEKAATVTEGGPLWRKTLEVPFCNQ
jgi:hypothetical protein